MEPCENFRLELRQGFEVKSAGDRNRITNRKEAWINDSNHISGIGKVQSRSFSCNHPMRTGQADFSSKAVVFYDQIPFKTS